MYGKYHLPYSYTTYHTLVLLTVSSLQMLKRTLTVRNHVAETVEPIFEYESVHSNQTYYHEACQKIGLKCDGTWSLEDPETGNVDRMPCHFRCIAGHSHVTIRQSVPSYGSMVTNAVYEEFCRIWLARHGLAPLHPHTRSECQSTWERFIFMDQGGGMRYRCNDCRANFAQWDRTFVATDNNNERATWNSTDVMAVLLSFNACGTRSSVLYSLGHASATSGTRLLNKIIRNLGKLLCFVFVPELARWQYGDRRKLSYLIAVLGKRFTLHYSAEGIFGFDLSGSDHQTTVIQWVKQRTTIFFGKNNKIIEAEESELVFDIPRWCFFFFLEATRRLAPAVDPSSRLFRLAKMYNLYASTFDTATTPFLSAQQKMLARDTIKGVLFQQDYLIKNGSNASFLSDHTKQYMNIFGNVVVSGGDMEFPFQRLATDAEGESLPRLKLDGVSEPTVHPTQYGLRDPDNMEIRQRAPSSVPQFSSSHLSSAESQSTAQAENPQEEEPEPDPEEANFFDADVANAVGLTSNDFAQDVVLPDESEADHLMNALTQLVQANHSDEPTDQLNVNTLQGFEEVDVEGFMGSQLMVQVQYNDELVHRTALAQLSEEARSVQKMNEDFHENKGERMRLMAAVEIGMGEAMAYKVPPPSRRIKMEAAKKKKKRTSGEDRDKMEKLTGKSHRIERVSE